MSWYIEAKKAIDKVISEKGYDKVTIKDIDDAYPFGERKNFPYKQWLKIRKLRLKQLGLIHSDVKLDGLLRVR